MKIGLCFPYTQPSMDRATMLEWFRRVEEGPFYGLSCGERMIGTSVDMGVTLAAAAAVTERIQIVPSLYVGRTAPSAYGTSRPSLPLCGRRDSGAPTRASTGACWLRASGIADTFTRRCTWPLPAIT